MRNGGKVCAALGFVVILLHLALVKIPGQDNAQESREQLPAVGWPTQVAKPPEAWRDAERLPDKPDDTTTAEQAQVVLARTKDSGKNLTCDCVAAGRAAFFSDRLEQCNVRAFALQQQITRAAKATDDFAIDARDVDVGKALSISNSKCIAGFVEREGAAQVGHILEFSLWARDDLGANLTQTLPFFWAAVRADGDVSDSSIFKIPVDLLPSGRHPAEYIGRFIIPEPGTYKLSVEHLKRQVCSLVFSAAGVAGEQQREAKSVCRFPAQFRNGFWRDEFTWQPTGCRLPRYERQVAKGKRVLFMGDSLIRCVFWCYATWMKGEPTSNHFHGYKLNEYDVVAEDTQASAHFQIKWEKNEYGYSVMDTHALLALLQNYEANHGSINQFDLVALAVGAHDLAREDGPIAYERFRVNLHTIMYELFTRLGYSGKAVWISETPSVPAKLNHGILKAYKTFQMESKVRRVNEIAERVVAQYGVPTLDVFPMALARPELAYDGQHYVRHEDTQKDPIYFNTVQALVHYFLADP